MAGLQIVAQTWGYRLGLIIALLAVATVIFGNSIGWNASSLPPARAFDLAPWDARTKLRLAEAELARGLQTKSRLAISADLARQALTRDPTLAGAWRTLGLAAAAQQRPAQARKILQTAERVSRRDLGVQLWLIEDAVQRQDVVRALRHYDSALRVSLGSRELLFPILGQALEQPQMRAPLANILSRDPPWAEAFYYSLAENPPAGGALHDLLGRVDRRVLLRSRAPLHVLVANLAGRNDNGAAVRVYRLLNDDPAAAGLLRNGGFDRENSVPPLDWQIEQAGSLAIAQEDGRLLIDGSSGSGGVVARQALALPSGAYRVSFRHGAEPQRAFRPSLLIRCAPTSTPLASIDDVAPIVRASRAFAVPASCTDQVIELRVQAEEGVEPSGWIDDVQITRQ